jgi:integrase
MKFEELAREYVGLNVFNSETGAFIQLIAKLFVERAEITECSEVNAEAITRFKITTLKTAKPVTYNGYLRYLRLLGDYGEANNHLDTNWFRKIKTARLGFKPPKIIKDSCLLAVLAHMESNEKLYRPVWFWRQVIMVLYYTGIRRRQLVSLLRRDVDLTNGLLTLRYDSSKTRREWRIPIHPELKMSLQAFIERVENTLGVSLLPTDTLFTVRVLSKYYRSDKANPHAMKPRTLTSFFLHVAEHSGIEISAHRFRHTFATKLCNPDFGEPDIFSVQQLLGHKDIGATRHYVQPQMGRLEAQVNLLQFPIQTQIKAENNGAPKNLTGRVA